MRTNQKVIRFLTLAATVALHGSCGQTAVDRSDSSLQNSGSADKSTVCDVLRRDFLIFSNCAGFTLTKPPQDSTLIADAASLVGQTTGIDDVIIRKPVLFSHSGAATGDATTVKIVRGPVSGSRQRYGLILALNRNAGGDSKPPWVATAAALVDGQPVAIPAGQILALFPLDIASTPENNKNIAPWSQPVLLPLKIFVNLSIVEQQALTVAKFRANPGNKSDQLYEPGYRNVELTDQVSQGIPAAGLHRIVFTSADSGCDESMLARMVVGKPRTFQVKRCHTQKQDIATLIDEVMGSWDTDFYSQIEDAAAKNGSLAGLRGNGAALGLAGNTTAGTLNLVGKSASASASVNISSSQTPLDTCQPSDCYSTTEFRPLSPFEDFVVSRLPKPGLTKFQASTDLDNNGGMPELCEAGCQTKRIERGRFGSATVQKKRRMFDSKVYPTDCPRQSRCYLSTKNNRSCPPLYEALVGSTPKDRVTNLQKPICVYSEVTHQSEYDFYSEAECKDMLDVSIFGAGTVEISQPKKLLCTGKGDQTASVPCDSIRSAGPVFLKATPATGWVFERWDVTNARLLNAFGGVAPVTDSVMKPIKTDIGEVAEVTAVFRRFKPGDLKLYVEKVGGSEGIPYGNFVTSTSTPIKNIFSGSGGQLTKDCKPSSPTDYCNVQKDTSVTLTPVEDAAERFFEKWQFIRNGKWEDGPRRDGPTIKSLKFSDVPAGVVNVKAVFRTNYQEGGINLALKGPNLPGAAIWYSPSGKCEKYSSARDWCWRKLTERTGVNVNNRTFSFQQIIAYTDYDPASKAVFKRWEWIFPEGTDVTIQSRLNDRCGTDPNCNLNGVFVPNGSKLMANYSENDSVIISWTLLQIPNAVFNPGNARITVTKADGSKPFRDFKDESWATPWIFKKSELVSIRLDPKLQKGSWLGTFPNGYDPSKESIEISMLTGSNPLAPISQWLQRPANSDVDALELVFQGLSTAPVFGGEYSPNTAGGNSNPLGGSGTTAGNPVITEKPNLTGTTTSPGTGTPVGCCPVAFNPGTVDCPDGTYQPNALAYCLPMSCTAANPLCAN